MKILNVVYIMLTIALTVGLLWLNLRFYYPRSSDYGVERVGPDVVAQLDYLKGALEDGAGEQMQGLFPEGYFFSYVLYGLSWVEVGLREATGSELHEQALEEARWALERLDSPAGRAAFAPTLDPPHGVFYVGWSNWLRGGILLLQPAEGRDAREVARFERDCIALAEAFERSATPFLTSYPRQAWPVDSVVGVAALRLHDRLLPPRFAATVEDWLEEAQKRLDPATGLLAHTSDPLTGEPWQGARGSSQSIIARFLLEIDPEWGHEQYALFRQHFVTTRLGVPAVLEYPSGTSGVADVDSGPLILGVSLSATVVTLGSALVQGDRQLAEPLLHSGEVLGLPITWDNKKRYAFGVMPVGDAFLVWSKNARPWLARPPSTGSGSASLPPVASWWWRLPWHGVSLLLVVGLWWRLRRWADFKSFRNF